MKRNQYILCFITLCVFLFCIFSAFAQTQQNLNLTTSPSSLDVLAKPGDTITQKVRVRNNGDTPLILTLSLKKLIPDISGSINLVEFSKNDDYQNWISFQTASITALPKEWTEIPFTIKPSKEAAFGYYYALFLSPKQEKQDTTKSETRVNGSLAIPILLTVVKDGATTNGKLLSFKSSANFVEYLPVSFLTTFHNNGNVHTRPRGNIFIKDFRGTTVDTLDINEALGSVLPNASRRFETVWNNSFITYDPKVQDGKIVTDKNGTVQKQLNFHFDKVLSLRIGKYTAFALVVVSGETKDTSFEATTTFWVFPWKIILGLLVVVVLAGIGLFSTAKSIWTGVRKVFTK